MKVVINKCFGGFGLSKEAILKYAELSGITLIEQSVEGITEFYKDSFTDDNFFSTREIARNDPNLVQVVKELGTKANDFACELKIVDVPDDVEWYVDDYDGKEWVCEKHRVWS